jgi:hypothetical protein
MVVWDMIKKFQNLVVLAMLIMAAMPGMVSTTTRTDRLMNISRRTGRPGFRPAIVILSMLIALLMITQGAYAQQIDNACMNDVYNEMEGGNLGCTANDVRIANATNINVTDPCLKEGDTVTFTADFEIILSAQARHDVGIYFANDGDPNSDGAYSGNCTISTISYTPSPTYVDLDELGDDTSKNNDFGYCANETGALSDPIQVCNEDADCILGDTCEEFGPGIQDTCGDIDDDHSPLLAPITLTVLCVDTDGDGNLNLPYCTSWRQPGSNELCLSPEAAYPGAPSKCKCDEGFNVDIPVPGGIIVDKVTLDYFGNYSDFPTSYFDFNLQGGPVPYNVDEYFTLNNSAEPHSVSGLVYGIYNVTELNINPDDWVLDHVECISSNTLDSETNENIDLGPGETVTCTFYNKEVIKPPIISVVKYNDADKDGIFKIEETYPGTTPGDFPVEITYKVDITNTAGYDAYIVYISDDTHSIAGSNLETLNNTPILAGQTLTGTFNVTFINADVDSVTNEITVTAENEAGSATATATSVVNFIQTPLININKTGVFNDEGDDGYGNVSETINYTYEVENTGNVNLTDVHVTDDNHGNGTLGDITCIPPQGSTLAPGGTMTCTANYIIAQADVDRGNVENNATANGTDPNGAPVTDEDPEIVELPQNPSIDVEKYVSVDNGGNWSDADSTYPYMIFGTDPQFKFVVNNTGNVNLTGIILTDTRLNMTGCGDVYDPLTPGASYVCYATDPWYVVLYNNTADVTGYFDEQPYTDTDDANYYAPSHDSP